jgi:hypothetical protein
MAGLFLTNTIPDIPFSDALSYTSTITDLGFTTALSGAYGGSSLNANYVGDLSLFPGVLSWTGSGNFGSNTWSGTGDALVSTIAEGTGTGGTGFISRRALA